MSEKKSKSVLPNAVELKSKKHIQGHQFHISGGDYNLHLPPLGIKFTGIPGKFSIVVGDKKNTVAQDGNDIEIRGSQNVQFNMIHDDAALGQVSMRMWIFKESDHDLALMKSVRQESIALHSSPMKAKLLEDFDWLGAKFGRFQVDTPTSEAYDVFGLYNGELRIEVGFFFSNFREWAIANEDLKKLRSSMEILPS